MPRYRIHDLERDEMQEMELPGPLRPVTLLPVPYVSQLEEGALAHRNDCGAAAAVMLLRACRGVTVSVDEFYDRVNAVGDGMLSIVGIRTALEGYRLFTEWRSGLTPANLYNYLMAGRPPMALIKYGVLRNLGLTEDKSFDGPHFVVVVGMDTRLVYVHDPLYHGRGGEAVGYPVNAFREAWVGAGRDPQYPAPESSALIPYSSVSTIGTNTPLYRAQVLTALRVRSGPGTTFGQVGLLNAGEIIGVYREQGGWGEIEPGLWVSLAYTRRL